MSKDSIPHRFQMFFTERMADKAISAAGVDVHASEGKPFYCAVLMVRLRGMEKASLLALETADRVREVVALMRRFHCEVVAIDAPQLGANLRSRDGLRPAERQMLSKYRLSLFPSTPKTFPAFRAMMAQGWKLYEVLMKAGYRMSATFQRRGRWLIEVYPHATFALLSPTPLAKKHTRTGRQQRFALLCQRIGGLREHFSERLPNPDENDALAAAYTACLFVWDACDGVGDVRDGGLIHVPRPSAVSSNA